MQKFTNNIIGKTALRAMVLLLVFTTWAGHAQARIVFDNEFLIGNTGSSTWIIDKNNDATGNIQLQFGNDPTPSENGKMTWNVTSNQLEVDHNLDLNQNQLKDVVVDNRSGTPPSSPVSGQMYYDTSDGNTYIYNGLLAQWEDVTLFDTTQTKVVTVGTGLDYTTIAAAATYLNGLSGGIMLLSAENHVVTTAVNLTNVTLIGKDATKTTVTVSGAGQLDSFDTAFRNLKLQINSITDDMAIDAQSGASSLFFEWVDMGILDSGDSLIDSNAGTAPTVTVKLVNCDQASGSGTILKTKAASNMNTSSEVFVSSSSGNNLLKISDWDATITGAGNVLTSGTISTIPSNTIYVYPGMNLQGAVDSLPTGGYITLLPGTHSITSPLLITNDNVVITGYGDASIISASGFSGITSTTAAIQVGAEDGSNSADLVVLKDFKVSVGSNNIHGIRVAGGQDNQITNVTVQKTAGTAASRDGILILNSDAAALSRPIVKNNRVLGNGGAIYFTNGVEVQLDNSSFAGTKGTLNALIDGNYADYVGEDGYSMVGMDSSSVFNNRAARMGVDGAAASSYGMYFSNLTNLNVNANVITNSQRVAAVGIGIDPDNQGSLKQSLDSIFTANMIDGLASGGTGFGTGILMGNASNTAVHRNSIQNNSIQGAATGTTTAINVFGDADDNSITNNSLTGGTNAWDTGITIQSATAERNILQGTRNSNVTVEVSDAGTNTRKGVSHHNSTADPTANDDQADGYVVGTIWVNTTGARTYVSVSDTVGAAVWHQIDASISSITLDDAYNNGSGTRTVTVDAGDVAWNLTGANNFIVDVQGTGSLTIKDNTVNFAVFTQNGDLDLSNNLTVGASAETITNPAFSLNGDDLFVSDTLGVEGQIYTDATAEKYLWVDIAGGVRNSAAIGTVATSESPVIRFDSTNTSNSLWSISLPDDWESGTNVLVDVFWSPADATAGNVVLTNDYAGWASGETVAAGSYSTLSSGAIASPGITQRLVNTTFTMAAGNFSANDMVNFRIQRDPTVVTDTYNNDVNIHMVRIRYTGKKLL